MKLGGRRDLGERGKNKGVERTVNNTVARRVEFRVPGKLGQFSKHFLRSVVSSL